MNQIEERIKQACLSARTGDPLELAVEIMHNSEIPIHGPVHHILDGACFLTALHHAGLPFDLDAALDEMILRGQKMPGATCGQWGVCGSAASVGAALAIVHETGPLSSNEYYKDNLRCVARALEGIAEVRGPRCCKRNAYLSIMTAAEFVKERYGLEVPVHDVACEFSKENMQCIGANCPFFKGAT